MTGLSSAQLTRLIAQHRNHRVAAPLNKLHIGQFTESRAIAMTTRWSVHATKHVGSPAGE